MIKVIKVIKVITRERLLSGPSQGVAGDRRVLLYDEMFSCPHVKGRVNLLQVLGGSCMVCPVLLGAATQCAAAAPSHCHSAAKEQLMWSWLPEEEYMPYKHKVK